MGDQTGVLADEPTGNLDHETAESIESLLLKLNRETGTSLILATHDLEFARKMELVLKLEDGILSPIKI